MEPFIFPFDPGDMDSDFANLKSVTITKTFFFAPKNFFFCAQKKAMNRETFYKKLGIIGVKPSKETKDYVDALEKSDEVDFEKISPETIGGISDYGKRELKNGNLEILKICMMYDLNK
jgi:hypothetical protein